MTTAKCSTLDSARDRDVAPSDSWSMGTGAAEVEHPRHKRVFNLGPRSIGRYPGNTGSRCAAQGEKLRIHSLCGWTTDGRCGNMACTKEACTTLLPRTPTPSTNFQGSKCRQVLLDALASPGHPTAPPALTKVGLQLSTGSEARFLNSFTGNCRQQVSATWVTLVCGTPLKRTYPVHNVSRMIDRISNN